MKILILESPGNATGFIYPIKRHKDKIEKLANVVFSFQVYDSVKELLPLAKRFSGDAIILAPQLKDIRANGRNYRREAGPLLVDVYRSFRTECPKKKIIHLDYSDSVASPNFNILPYVDLFVKSYVSSDLSEYDREYCGGFKFVHELVTSGVVQNSITDEVWTDLFSSRIPKGHESKVVVGWSCASFRSVFDLVSGRIFLRELWKDRLINVALSYSKRLPSALSGNKKTIDLYFRGNMYHGWCAYHRKNAVQLCRQLESEIRVVAGHQKVTLSEYFRELSLSRMFVSPFGWGEYAPKDYEAMFFNSLLLKPSVEHVLTNPGLLVPYETYVPLRWDLSDLQEKVRFYHNNDQERLRIAQNAKRALTEFFKEDGFVNLIGALINKIKSINVT